MTDETKLHQAVSRAARAKALVEDELLVEAFDVTTRAYLDDWMKTAPTETATREQLWLAIQNLGKVKAHLRNVVANGKFAQQDLDELHVKQRRKAA